MKPFCTLSRRFSRDSAEGDRSRGPREFTTNLRIPQATGALGIRCDVARSKLASSDPPSVPRRKGMG
jgi:hypothetical protein